MGAVCGVETGIEGWEGPRDDHLPRLILGLHPNFFIDIPKNYLPDLDKPTKMSPPPLHPTSSVLIIGAGTWGCSTALHLARRGYKCVKVLDPHPVPSPIAAGNDVNKIMEHKELKGKKKKAVMDTTLFYHEDILV